MEQNNKTLLIAVLIILLALVAFNFNNISGRPVTEISDASIRVSPSIVTMNDRSAGEYVDVTVDTGSGGLEKIMYLHRVNGARVGTVTDSLCNRNICDGVISKRFFIPASVESGSYYISMGKGSASINSNTFTVRHV